MCLSRKEGNQSFEDVVCAHTCAGERRKEGVSGYPFLFSLLFLCHNMWWLFYKNIFTVRLMCSHENAVLQKCRVFLEVFYGWLLHHNFHVFITLWSVSGLALRHMLPFPFLFSFSQFFFFCQLGKEGNTAGSFDSPSTGEWKIPPLPP